MYYHLQQRSSQDFFLFSSWAIQQANISRHLTFPQNDPVSPHLLVHCLSLHQERGRQAGGSNSGLLLGHYPLVVAMVGGTEWVLASTGQPECSPVTWPEKPRCPDFLHLDNLTCYLFQIKYLTFREIPVSTKECFHPKKFTKELQFKCSYIDFVSYLEFTQVSTSGYKVKH